MATLAIVHVHPLQPLAPLHCQYMNWMTKNILHDHEDVHVHVQYVQYCQVNWNVLYDNIISYNLWPSGQSD